MSTQTKTDKKSKLQQESSNTTAKKNSLIDIKVLEDTPFGTVTIEGKSFGVIGQNRITEEYDDVEKLKEDLRKIDWNKIEYTNENGQEIEVTTRIVKHNGQQELFN